MHYILWIQYRKAGNFSRYFAVESLLAPGFEPATFWAAAAFIAAALFCSTRVPLTSTRWVWLPFSSLCPLYSKLRRQLIPATARNSWEFFLVMLGIKPGAAGWEARMLPLCFEAPPCSRTFLQDLSLIVDTWHGRAISEPELWVPDPLGSLSQFLVQGLVPVFVMWSTFKALT